MFLLLLLAPLAFGGDDVFVVPEGATAEVAGPAVWLTEERFRQYVADSRKLPVCTEALDKAIDLSIEANERTLHVREIALTEFHLVDEEDAVQIQTIAEQAVRLDTQADRITRLRSQRNVAWGIAGGFLAASTSAVVLSLSRSGV